MNRTTRSPRLLLLGPICLATLIGAPLLGQDGSTYHEDLLADLQQLEEKMVGLAEAIPAEQYSWAPAEGVRTVSQALMHTANANYFFPTLIGAAAAGKGNLESITDKDQAIAELKGSFAHLRQALEDVGDASMAESIDLFGRKTTVAGTLHAALSHVHEHLGQTIAYARSIGVTPPWSQ
ncbi:MAG TPA: DinB family protein [Thermoanaerobaculia bacterium]|nr:DinB family protein [Thermoanaerobaculia bacterium]